ncbi:DNA polymerase III subunit epsilon [Aliidiomarina minuta]|uniref:DNA polymerase III subunit epsilon n=1 Tax=Aliidiomarina minuta TaxID=880057 RepID=A0A432W7T6_9GAMM|nr:DNA polymerase III subunit epsilon [Aliidiomarina minuta]RUO26079.1 DNA polymerase III subunit epsilon [Aliidiomarina minuta]
MQDITESKVSRQIVLDTETTGIDPRQGHRIIEIGCVELIDRKLTGNHFHVYLNPERLVEQEAINIHGITNEYLEDKPVFAQVADEFIEFIHGAELVIHNAPFDVGHMDAEFQRMQPGKGFTKDYASVLDTLALARTLYPGQRASLDALCKRFDIDNSHRELHGALLDAEILADVYLWMTGGQRKLSLAGKGKGEKSIDHDAIRRLPEQRSALKVLAASADEEEAHRQRLEQLIASGGKSLWPGSA